MESITKNNFTITYIDTCPSELLHNSKVKYLCIGLVNYFKVERTQLQKLNQFKSVRSLERKLKTQDYIIDNIKKGNISLTGVVNWNYSKIALENGQLLLHQCNLIPKHNNFQKIESINNESITYGIAASLAWYSLVLSTFFNDVGVITKLEKKKNAAIFFDLISGDDIFKKRNLNIVRYIIDHSELRDFRNEAIKSNKIKGIGYGYGIKEGLTKNLKNDFEYTILDWIVQSFNSFITSKEEHLNEDSKDYKLSKLAVFLLKNSLFKISGNIKLIQSNLNENMKY